MASILDALFGRIFNQGTELDLVGGLNMVTPLKATLNNAAGRIDIAIDSDLLADLIAELGAATSADNVTYDDTGNAVVTGADAQAALDQIEALLNGAIAASNLASNAVTTAKILDANVTTAKIADGNVTAVKLASDSVTTAKVLDANITAAKLASDAVTTAKILDANVTTAKIADGGVTTAKIAEGVTFSKTTAGGGNPKLTPAPAHASAMSVSSGGNAITNVSPGEDGYFEFTARCVFVGATSGDYYRISAVIDAVRVSGTLTVVGSQTDLPGGYNTGLTLTLSETGGSLRAQLDNAAGENVSGYFNLGWIRSDVPT